MSSLTCQTTLRGLQLLRLGQYSEAKEKLTRAIIAPGDRLIDAIVAVLEEPGEPLGEEAVSDSSMRYMQAVFYLHKFGSSDQLLRFWLRNECIEDACRYIVHQGLPESLFVDMVVRHCIAFNLMSALYDCLPRIGTVAEKNQYLVAACSYLAQRKSYRSLLEFQVNMCDWTRAGLTCITLFHTCEKQDQLKYLQRAQQLFQKALREPPPPSVMTELEVARAYKKIQFQMQITRLNQPALRQHTMFGSSKDAIAQTLIVYGHFDLAFKIIQEFRLPVSQIYSAAIVEMAKLKGDKSQFIELLKVIKGTIDSEEMDAVLLSLVDALSNHMDEPKAAEKFVSKISNPKMMIRGYISIGKLKSAYVLAARNRWASEVRAVRTAALEAGVKNVVQLCNTYLGAN